MPEPDQTVEAQLDAHLARMRTRVTAAIDDACRAFAETMVAAGRDDAPPPREYFASCVMQLAFGLQCRADGETLQGGDAGRAWHAIQNAVDISNHYWGSRFALRRDEAPPG